MIATDIFGSPPSAPIPATQGAIFTGTPSLATKYQIGAMFALKDIAGYLGPNLDTQLSRVTGALFSLEFSNTPPKFLPLLLGETVQHTTFDGMPVLQITPAHPSGHYVVALPGGDYSLEPSFFHWLDYTLMANQTGATIEVPFYPLVQQGGARNSKPGDVAVGRACELSFDALTTPEADRHRLRLGDSGRYAHSRRDRAAADMAGGQSSTHRLGETTDANQLQQSNQQHRPSYTCENNEFCVSSSWYVGLREQVGGHRSTGRSNERNTQIDLPHQHRDPLLPIPAVDARSRPALNISDIRPSPPPAPAPRRTV